MDIKAESIAVSYDDILKFKVNAPEEQITAEITSQFQSISSGTKAMKRTVFCVSIFLTALGFISFQII